MSLIDRFLKLTISVQIRVGIITVVVFAVIIFLALLIVSTLIQYNTMINYYEQIIDDEDNKMLLNYEQYIHSLENILERKSKTDLKYYSLLESNFIENLEGLELSTLLTNITQIDKVIDVNEESEKIDECFNSGNVNCIVYKFFPEDSTYKKESEEFNQLLKYYNLIFPLLNSTIQEKIGGTHILGQYNNLQFYKIFYDSDNNVIGKVIFFAGTNISIFDREYNEAQFINNTLNNIYDQIMDFIYLITDLNKKVTLSDILINFNNEFSSIPLITSKYLFEGEINNPFKRNIKQKSKSNIYENNISFESKYLDFKFIEPALIYFFVNTLNEEGTLFPENYTTMANYLLTQVNSFTIFKWTDSIMENLLSIISEKYKTSLNILTVIHSLFSIYRFWFYKTSQFQKIVDENFLTKVIITQFSCIYIVQQQLLKNEISFEQLNSFNITKCYITFNDDFNEYLRNSPPKIDIFDRRKIKIEITKYDIKYIFFNYSNGEESVDEEYSLHYEKDEDSDQKLSNYLKYYKIYQGIYPTDSLNTFKNDFYQNFITVNFYFSNLYSSYYDIDNIQSLCNIFFTQVLYPSLILWAIVLIIIIIIVFKISDSISNPIDKLIQSVSMNDKSSKEMNKYLKNISYKDDSTINDLFVLCKKLIIGGFRKEGEEQQKKKVKTINAYNNISLVKTNNMIINESEIMEGEKKQEINYFEKNIINKNKKAVNINSHLSSISSGKKINFKVLSEPIFTGKFYQNNKGYLIKDKELFEILTNEINTRKKKFYDDNKSKNKNSNHYHHSNNKKD